MKIAILTSGILPVPAIHGGAVETLIDFYKKTGIHHSVDGTKQLDEVFAEVVKILGE